MKSKTRLRVLVVEDEDEIKAYLKSELSDEYKVETCSNGKEAYDLILRDTPDLVISDVMMPEMDGNELCRCVKADKRTNNIPFVLLTAKQSVYNKVEGLTIGADDYVTKPFNVEILILRMRKLIDLSKKRKAKSLIDPEPSEIAITSLDEKLVENAIKYNHSGGKVTVKISQTKALPVAHSKPADYALVEVTDTGIGISPEYQEKIFAPFFRVDKSRSRAMGGAGLGLALVAEIARQHGGQVKVLASSKKGSTIALMLPINSPLIEI